jgi:hypothetical protein
MIMDEFARLMSMEGVRPLDRLNEKSRRLAKQPGQVSSQGAVAPPELAPVATRGFAGPRARTALETALERLATEIRGDGAAGQPAFVRMVRRSRCLLRQERHRCSAPQIASRCVL